MPTAQPSVAPPAALTAANERAREAKEAYYEARQGHDRALAAFQSLQGKTETVKDLARACAVL